MIPEKQGFYWARTNGKWNKIIRVHGASPFMNIQVWDVDTGHVANMSSPKIQIEKVIEIKRPKEVMSERSKPKGKNPLPEGKAS